MLFNFFDSLLTFIYFWIFTILLIDVWNIPRVEHIILKTLRVLGERLQVMRSYEPLSIAVLFFRHLIHDVLLIVLRRQESLIRRRSVFIHQLFVISYGTELLCRIKMFSPGMPFTLFFSFSLKIKLVVSPWHIVSLLEKMLIITLARHLLFSFFFSSSLLF